MKYVWNSVIRNVANHGVAKQARIHRFDSRDCCRLVNLPGNMMVNLTRWGRVMPVQELGYTIQEIIRSVRGPSRHGAGLRCTSEIGDRIDG
jgi:hypothetical protein